MPINAGANTCHNVQGSESEPKGGTESGPENVEKSVEKIIRTMKENPEITVKELRISRRGVEKNIKKLQEKELLRRVGPDNGGNWEIINKDVNE